MVCAIILKKSQRKNRFYFSFKKNIFYLYFYHVDSLEVKYMKLATETTPGGGNYDQELPGVDSCALEDGEEEQCESVSFKQNKGIRFFKFGKNKHKVSVNYLTLSSLLMSWV